MKNDDPGKDDEPLRKVLKEWRSDAPLPLRFKEQVWRRLESAPVRSFASPWAAIGHWIGTMLPRPLLASSYVAVVLVIGVTAGWAQARQETARVKSELGEHYVRVLDPYLAPRQ